MSEKSEASINTNIEVLRELDELVEAARLLGATQAKRLFGCYTDEDRRFERAMYESIDKHRAALLNWKAGCHCGTCTCDPNMTPSAGQTTGITATELGYALKRATPAQVIEYLEDDVDMHVALSIYFEELHNQQPAVEVELLPLPAEDYVDDEGLWEQRYGPYSPDQMKDYARANIAHATAALQVEIEALRKLLDRMVVCNPDGSVGIRVTEDALNAAAELYRLFGDAKKEAGND